MDKTQEESFLFKILKLESLFNKYKIQIISTFILIIVIIFGFKIKSYIDEQNLIATNKAYYTLLTNPNDKKALEELKKNKKLYRLYILHTAATLKDVNKLETIANGNDVISNIAKYEIAALKENTKLLENYSLTINSVYKDLALFNLERIYLENKNHKKAEEVFKQIKDNTIKEMAKELLHYGIVK